MKRFVTILAVNPWLFVSTESFVISPSQECWQANRFRIFMVDNNKDSSDDEPDLLEYFDPLLSPHAYPKGISPDNKFGQHNEGLDRSSGMSIGPFGAAITTDFESTFQMAISTDRKSVV